MGDWPDIAFLQAEKYRTGRPDGPPLWIVWHTMEEDELPDRAEAVANYFAHNTGSRSLSAHYCHDNDSTVQCVLLRDTAWTVGNRPGNNRGINHELAGRASQRSSGWADDFSQAMLRRAAAVAKRDMARYDIPNRWCSVSDLRALRAGHTTHNDLRLAFGGTTHTDPGSDFPRNQVMDFIEEDEMSWLARIPVPSWVRKAFDPKGTSWPQGTTSAQGLLASAYGHSRSANVKLDDLLGELRGGFKATLAAVHGEDAAAAIEAELGKHRALMIEQLDRQWDDRAQQLGDTLADVLISAVSPSLAAAVSEELTVELVRTRMVEAIRLAVGASTPAMIEGSVVGDDGTGPHAAQGAA